MSLIPLPSSTYNVRSVGRRPITKVNQRIVSQKNVLIKDINDVTLTGNEDIDMLVLESLDSVQLNNLDVNSYTRKILSNPEFWKRRVEKRLGLTSTRPNIDYEYISKSLDNGKSFEENYERLYNDVRSKNNRVQIDKKYEVLQILDDNKVIKPNDLLGSIFLTLFEIFNYKDLPYNEFINNVIRLLNQNLDDDEIDEANEYAFRELNTVIYSGKDLTIIVETGYEENENLVSINLHSNNGFTEGQILYELAKKLPGADFNHDDLSLLYAGNTYFEGLRLDREKTAYDLILSS